MFAVNELALSSSLLLCSHVNCFIPFCSILAARVGRKRGKMNLEKTINKNMFDVSTSIRDNNPLQTPDLTKNDPNDSASSTPLSSILAHPKQKLTAQFKRAITMIKQRSEPSNDSPTPQFLTSASAPDRPTASLEPTLLASLIEESNADELQFSAAEVPPSRSQTLLTLKSPTITSLSQRDSELSTPSAATVINLGSSLSSYAENENGLTNRVKPSLQQLRSLAGQQNVAAYPASSSGTISSTPSSSSATTGEIVILETML